ncbi:outer membrane protein assembly factor BamB family protein [Saccharicrinis aurantiacus]|uniref:outer membrane protein assembly factor BamB family protein n=1 Tax=Saccharicrinis aurantiacus TaxID=1849719 RepID=UPI00094F9789|nr:WD40 repeat domain-containing protein [Saccharicrinis aurantiacus]
MKKLVFLAVILMLSAINTFAIKSITTDYTITKVRIANSGNKEFIVASAYDGQVLAYDYKGKMLWENELSGYMNHELWAEDITGDGKDEVFAANADGNLYCLDAKGKVLWQFKNSETPMYAIAVVHKEGTPYVVCGDYSNSIFYLDVKGKKIKEVKSSTYSKEKTFGDVTEIKMPPKNTHIANFLRKVKLADGSEKLAVLGTNNSMQTTGSLYMFDVLADKPYSTKKIKSKKAQGYMEPYDVSGDGNQELILGPSSMIQDAGYTVYNTVDNTQKYFNFKPLHKQFDRFGYRVVQTAAVKLGGETKFLSLFGTRIILMDTNMKPGSAEVLSSKCSYNDMWYNANSNQLVLASAQSGGNGIHIIDLNSKSWKNEYKKLVPAGNVQAMLDNHATARKQLSKYKKPSSERDPLPVYMLSDSKFDGAEKIVADIKKNYESPIFLNYYFSPFAQDPKDWNREQLGNAKYVEKRDKRKKYTKTQEELVSQITKKYDGMPGIAMWGGHGNDPYFYSLETLKEIIDAAHGKKTVFIFPELEKHDEDFKWVLNNHIYPLAEYAQGRNTNIYIRTKHTFWQGPAYMPQWNRMLSGEFADVFVPSMEETTDKSMELSVAARMGYWMSGAVDSWGARCARDNTSFDRMRQHSHQDIPNHFLRQMVYNVASGSRYLNNFVVDQEYMSLFWELIAKGVLYVPERNELLSLSPVHLGMLPPDEHMLEEGHNVKWLTFYDEKKEKANPMVFSHLNGSWPGAPVTEWDFSNYAAGVKDRRLNFLPNYKNGMVLMTPVQEGKFAMKDAKREALVNQLHPIYKNITKEYITDGAKYYSADGSKTYSANEYYKVIQKDIEEGAQKLPLTVEGDVAWVVAQTGPKNLRLTIIDGGYINPKDREAKITFNTVKPVKMVDLLDGKSFKVSNPSNVTVDVPCGLFRFIDIELSEELK